MSISPESTNRLSTTDFSFREFAKRPEYRVVTEEYMKECVEQFLASPDIDHQKPLRIGVIGSGNGLGLQGIFEALTDHPATVVCMDLNKDAISELLENTNPPENVKTLGLVGDGTKLPFRDETFDLIFLPNWLHMLQGKDREESFKLKLKVVEECARTLKSKGRLCMLGSFIEDQWIPTTADGLRWGKMKRNSITKLGGTLDEKNKGFILHRLEEYVKMMQLSGLEYDPEKKVEVVVPLTADSARAIPLFTGWTEGMFLDMVEKDKYTLDEKIYAQQEVITEMELQHLKRAYRKREPLTPFTMGRVWVGLTAVKI